MLVETIACRSWLVYLRHIVLSGQITSHRHLKDNPSCHFWGASSKKTTGHCAEHRAWL